MRFSVLLILLVCWVWMAEGTISNGFRQFIRRRFGRRAVQWIARDDLWGGEGSFGGTARSNMQRTGNNPIVMIHGASSIASHIKGRADYFRSKGFANDELFATTYGRLRHRGPNQRSSQRGNWCDYVRRVRALMIAVNRYTGYRRLIVIGYSLGGAMTRKAIKGGRCLRERKSLGPPLTKMIKTYLSVAGAQRAKSSCGVDCAKRGKCGSPFHNDINSRRHYEAVGQVLSLRSVNDQIISNDRCGVPASRFSSVDKEVVIKGYTHEETCWKTADYQYKMIMGLPT